MLVLSGQLAAAMVSTQPLLSHMTHITLDLINHSKYMNITLTSLFRLTVAPYSLINTVASSK